MLYLTTRLYMAEALSLAAAIDVVPASRAQAPASPSQAPAAGRDLKLRGDRFAPLTWDQLTPAQRTMVEHLLSGERGGLN